MTTSTQRLDLTEDAYANASNGNINCVLFLRTDQRIRFVVAGIEPAVDTDVCVVVSGPYERTGNVDATAALSFEGLSAEAELWVRSDDGHGPQSLVTMRGDTRVRLN